MLQKSRYLVKSVSPPIACRGLSSAIRELFTGCSQQKLYSLMHNFIESEYHVASHRYGCLHKLHICPKRNISLTAALYHDKTSNGISFQSVDKEKENATTTSQSSYQHLGNECENAGLSRHMSENSDFNKILAGSPNVLSSPIMPKNGKNKDNSFMNTAYTNNRYIGRAFGNSLNDGDHSKPTQENVCDNKESSNSPYNEINEDKPGCHVLESKVNGGRQNGDSFESVKTPNDVKIQKGKSTILFEKAKNLLRKSSDNQSETDAGSAKPISHEPTQFKKRQSVDLNRCSTERNFITPIRAMTDFLLKPTDLDGLRKTKRRSPYENDPPITVYWRKDVEAKAIDVWGSKENLLKEILKRDTERRRYQQRLPQERADIFTVKRRLRDYRREQGRETEFNSEQNSLRGPTRSVVLTAIFINGLNFLIKLVAWLYTGSHSMFSETVHSLADTINQVILGYGIHKSVQKADSDHPYGYTYMRYVTSLISGVGIFFLGFGLSMYHGVIGLTDPTPVESYNFAFFILAGSLGSEGVTLLMAINSVLKGAKAAEMKVTEYILRGNDPSVNVILLEDAAAVLGVVVAGCSMGLSALCNSHIPDAIGSLLVGCLLAGVATFIIYTNVTALVGRSISQERLDKINAELESDIMIRAIHDVKGIDIGNSLVRYKAEMDFDGRELTRSYLDKQDLNQLLEEITKFETIDQLEEFMLKHGENIVDMLGGEIDRIELKLRKKHPEIRHCDLEIL